VLAVIEYAAERSSGNVGLDGHHADGSTIELVNAPPFQLEHRYAKVPTFYCG
jgi:hypothetical protein